MANIKFSDFAARTSIASVDYIVGYQGGDNIQIAPTDFLGEYLPLAGGTMTGNLKLNDGVVLQIGSSADLQLFHELSNSYISNNIGDLTIRNLANDKDIILLSDDGSGGHTAYLTLDGSQTNIHCYVDFRIYDDKKLQLGNGADFEAFHNGTHMYMANNTGDWYITQAADNEDIIFRGDDGSGGAATYFYMDGSLVNGTSVKGATRFPDSSKIYMGTGGDLEIFHDGTNTYLENYTGDFIFTQAANDKDIQFKSDDGSGGSTLYYYLDGSIVRNRFPKNVYLEDDVKLLFGDASTPDLEIYHDASNSYIKETGTGNLYIQASERIRFTGINGDALLYLNENSNVEMYYDNALRLDTTDDGVAIRKDNAGALGPVLLLDNTAGGNGDSSAIVFASGGNTYQRAQIKCTADVVAPHNGSIEFYTGRSDLGTLTEKMRIAYDGNVGIATTTPDEKLHITDNSGANIILNSNAVAANSGVYMTEGASAVNPKEYGAYTYYDGTNNAFKIATGTTTLTDRLTIARDTGNVGIGTDAPPSKLSIEDGDLEFRTTDAATIKNKIIFSESTWGDESFYIEHDGAGAGAANILKIYGDGSGGTAGGVLIARDGNVAVGGTNTTYKFNVHEGDMFIGATVAAGGRGIYFQRTGATNAWSLIQGHNGTNAIELREGADTRMFWENGGDVGIGTITPAYALEVDGTATATDPSYIVATETAGIFKMAIGVQNSPGVAQECFVGTLGNTDWKFKANNTDVGRVTTTGKLMMGSSGIPTAPIQVIGIAEYTDNAAALADGLTAGAFYRTGDLLKVVH